VDENIHLGKNIKPLHCAFVPLKSLQTSLNGRPVTSKRICNITVGWIGKGRNGWLASQLTG
jgi:hypothetical protein